MKTNFIATIESHNTNSRTIFFSDWYFTPTQNANVFKARLQDAQGTRSMADRNFMEYIAERYGLKAGKDYSIIA